MILFSITRWLGGKYKTQYWVLSENPSSAIKLCQQEDSSGVFKIEQTYNILDSVNTVLIRNDIENLDSHYGGKSESK